MGNNHLTSALGLYRDDEPTRSELEALFLALLDDHGLPRPLINHAVEARRSTSAGPRSA